MFDRNHHLHVVAVLLLATLPSCGLAAPSDDPAASGTGTVTQAVIYGLTQTQSNDALWPVANIIDGNDGTVYSSRGFATQVNDRSTWVAAWFGDGPHLVSQVRLTARLDVDHLYGFPKRYEVQITAADNSSWVSFGDYTTQPDTDGVAIVNLGWSYPTYGVRIIPKILGDDGGGYYFQLAELQLATGLQTVYPMTPFYVSEQLDNTTWNPDHLTDGEPGTYYSSRAFATAETTRGLIIAAWAANGPVQASRVVLHARMVNGVPLGFPAEYDLLVTNASSSLIPAGHFSVQPNPAGVATVDLGNSYTTYGVALRPTVLGTDDNGTHYLQLGEIALANNASSGVTTLLTSPILMRSKQVVVPNQIAANLWYRPGGQLINGHIEDSYADSSLWPNLRTRLNANDGGLGLYAAEIGYLSSGTLMNFRKAGIPVSVEVPGMTQCLSGTTLGNLELFGPSPTGLNYFASIFHIDGSQSDRLDPRGHGWFANRDGNLYAPDEIIFDERMPNLVRRFWGPDIANGDLSWNERKARSLIDACPSATSFHPWLDRISGLIADYVDYIQVARSRYGRLPKFAIHWNVNPGWEWADEACLDSLNQAFPKASDFANAYNGLWRPCHRDTQYLIQLVTTLCNAGTCPSAVYMDIDYLYNTGYAIDVLQRNKAALASLGVPFGLNIVDQSTAIHPVGWTVIPSPDGSALMLLDRHGDGSPASENALHQETLLNVVNFFLGKGIIDGNTRLRIGAWDHRPFEQGRSVSEAIPGSLANTVLRIFNEYLIPRGLAH